MAYDAKGNLLTSIQTLVPSTLETATISFTYEPVFNQVTQITDPRGNPITITYDAKGNPRVAMSRPPVR